jgi:hypothetical protein
MARAIITLILLVLGAVALCRGLYLRAELVRQLDTGTMGVVRSWVMWSTTDGRELVAWYRRVVPWLVWGGAGLLVSGMAMALWPERPPEEVPVKTPRKAAQKPPRPPRRGPSSS